VVESATYFRKNPGLVGNLHNARKSTTGPTMGKGKIWSLGAMTGSCRRGLKGAESSCKKSTQIEPLRKKKKKRGGTQRRKKLVHRGAREKGTLLSACSGAQFDRGEIQSAKKESGNCLLGELEGVTFGEPRIQKSVHGDCWPPAKERWLLEERGRSSRPEKEEKKNQFRQNVEKKKKQPPGKNPLGVDQAHGAVLRHKVHMGNEGEQ